MTDNEDVGENTSRGNEWEVVSLTESAYGAAPGPNKVELSDDDKTDIVSEEAETSHAMFMSTHFSAFPPSQHENLPVEPEKGSGDEATEFTPEEEGRSSGKDDDNLNLEGLNVSDEFPAIQKDDSPTFCDTEFEGETNKNLTEEQHIYTAAKYASFTNEASLGGTLPGYIEQLEQDFDDGDVTRSPRSSKEDEHELPCGAWWKRGAVSLYSHAKEANAFWSVIVAAAVMGLVILGHHWQQERWQILQHKWQFGLNNEKTSRIFGPISRLKDVIVGGHRRSSLIRATSPRDN